jgi:N-acetylmuramoyl-L-alanine amidase
MGTGPLVVIDPGHGGTNSGAPGLHGHEKEVTLAISRRLKSELEGRGIAAVLTRTDDRYLTLRQRSELANELGAELFVSIHANASLKPGQRGFETYVLSRRAVDVDARALRADSGRPRLGLDRETSRILDDIERGTAQPAAADLARSINRHLGKARGRRADRGVKQESMHVLLGATMPAVLVEVGFMDDPVEGRELFEPEVQARIASALADGIAARR